VLWREVEEVAIGKVQSAGEEKCERAKVEERAMMRFVFTCAVLASASGLVSILPTELETCRIA
jgi:hypothetical protein